MRRILFSLFVSLLALDPSNAGAQVPADAGSPAAAPVASCPIEFREIHPHWVIGSGDPWGSYLLVWFKNVSPKTIAAIRFGVSFVDALGDAHKSVYSYDSDLTVKPGKSSNPSWSDGVYAGELSRKVHAIVWVEKIRFADNSFFTDDGSHVCGGHSK